MASEIVGTPSSRPTTEIVRVYVDYAEFRTIVRDALKRAKTLTLKQKRTGSVIIFNDCPIEFSGGEIEKFIMLRDRLKRIGVDVKVLPSCTFRNAGSLDEYTRTLNRHERIYAFERIEKVEPDPGAKLPATFLGCTMSGKVVQGLLKEDATLISCIVDG